MAPKKRSKTGVAHHQTTAAARVPCPACQKEVPSFFVNSHLDLECPVLNSPSLPAPCRSSNCGTTSTSADLGAGLSPQASRPLEAQSPRIIVDAEFHGVGDAESVGERHGYGTGGQGITEGNAEERESASHSQRDGKGVASLSHEQSAEDQSLRDMPSDPEPEMAGGASDAEEVGCSNQRLEITIGSSSATAAAHSNTRELGAEALLTKKRSFAMSITRTVGNFSTLQQKPRAPKGHHILEDFVSREEEEHLLSCLDMDVSNPWKLSRVNGVHIGKSYGNHIFGDLRRRIASQTRRSMPTFISPYVERMRNEVHVLKGFFPNEMNSIDYRVDEGHHLKAHMDDRQLSGTILVNLSLGGSCIMTYARERGVEEVYRIKLLPRSLQILTGESRYNFTHGIKNNDLLDPRRVSMTFRQSVEKP